MNRLKPWVALIVLALWASCAIRCEAISLTGTAALGCCSEADDDCGGKPASPGHCVCSWVQSGGYIPENNSVPRPQQIVMAAFPQPMDEPAARPAAQAAELILSPPELLTNWQFFQRTALSPRAPSFVS